MYYLYSVIAAMLIAVMVVANGQLSDAFNSYEAGILIHAIGLFVMTIVIVVHNKRDGRRFYKFGHSNINLSLILYSGGAIGVATTLFNNLAFGKISVTAIIALSLLGQMITSLIIDGFGLFSMPKRRLTVPHVIGLVVILGGIIYLLQESYLDWFAIILSLLTGITVVLSRFVNAMLAEKRGLIVSTWYNFFIGFIVSVLIFLSLYAMGEIRAISIKINGNWFMFTGGVIGVAVVALSSVCANKISALILTLIMFIGQLYTGVLLDYWISGYFSKKLILGGLLASIGLLISLFPVKKRKYRDKR